MPRPPPIPRRRPAAAARGSTGIRAERRHWRPIAGSASRTAASRSISKRGTCGASNRANCADRVGSLRADAADRRRARKSRAAPQGRCFGRRRYSGCTLALPGRRRTGLWRSRLLVHARRRAGPDRPRASGLRLATVICFIPAVSSRCGCAPDHPALTLPPARPSRFFLTLDPVVPSCL